MKKGWNWNSDKRELLTISINNFSKDCSRWLLNVEKLSRLPRHIEMSVLGTSLLGYFVAPKRQRALSCVSSKTSFFDVKEKGTRL